jgi:ATP-dependent RNA helicase DBP3
VAATGSGKTLGFGLPALEHIQKLGKAQPQRPHVLVLAPTRELAVQTYKVAQNAGQLPDVRCRSLCVYGGTAKHTQAKELRKGVDMLIATPGRLIDLMGDEAVSLENVKYCVLDEADRMLDMGFEKDIRHIMGSVNQDR